MKTETELKETWCPYAQVGFVTTAPDQSCVGLIGNRVTNLDDECNCIGFACSQCMDCGAVVEIGDHIPDDIKSPDHDPYKPGGEGWKNRTAPLGAPTAQRWERETGERHAYCGRNTGEALRQELYGMAQSIINAINGISGS